MIRNVFSRQIRLFTCNARFQKTATDAVKDVVKGVDRKVSDTLVAGIDKTSEVAHKAKQVAASSTSAAPKEMPSAGKIKGKAHELAGQAKGKAAEMQGEFKSKM